MKRGILTIIVFLIGIFIFPDYLNTVFDLTDRVKTGNYAFYNDTIGMPVIRKNIIFNNRVRIKNIQITYYSADSIINFNTKKNNYIYSLNGNSEILLKSPKKHYFIQSIGYSGNNTIVSIDFFPFIKTKNNIDAAYIYNINIDYEVIDTLIIKSPFDFLYNINDNIDNYKVKLRENKAQKQAFLDLLIITSSFYTDSIIRLQNLMSLLGFRSELKTIEDIDKEFNGVDLPEKIRNYIIKKYKEAGIRFVIIAGDVDIVPVRYAYNNNFYYYGYIATDTYYSDIDGDWNADNNQLIGNLQSDNIDAYPDIALGRLPFSNPGEFHIIMEKTYNYIFHNDTTKINSFLLAGASIREDLSDGLGQKMNDRIIELENSNDKTFYKLYSPISDTFNETPYWTNGNNILIKSSFIGEMNKGYHFINHIDHTDASWFGTGFYAENSFMLHPDSLDFYSNNIYSIIFSMGCSSNAFDRETISEMFMLSSKSPITFYTGFTRTGWTNAENTMLEYWNTMLNKETSYTGQALINASLSSNQYFRITLNNLGIPVLPVYNKSLKHFIVNAPDTIINSDTFTINVSNGEYAVENASVVIWDSEHFFRDSTDLAGNVIFNSTFSDSLIIFCINAPSFLPYIDTIFVKNKAQIIIDTLFFPSTTRDSINVCIVNNTDTIIRNLSLNVKANDSLFSINDVISIRSLLPRDTVFIKTPIDYNKSPLYSIIKNVLFSYRNKNAITINMQNSLYIQKDSIIIQDFFIDSISENLIIDSLKIINCTNQSIKNAKITLSADSFTIIDSVFIKDFQPFDTILLTQISTTNVYSKQKMLDSYYNITVNAYSRQFSYNIKGNPLSAINMNFSYDFDGLFLYHPYDNVKAIVYRSDDGVKFYIADSFNYNKHSIIQKDFISPYTYFYTVFYDKANRFMHKTQTLKINTFFNSYISNTKISGTFYGKLNNRRYYARSSFNCADLNNDGINEFVVLSDDGKLIILDDKLNNITPVKINVSAFNEYTPAIGNIDNNDYNDIVISGGDLSDTSALIILNPFNNPKIISIERMGVLKSSPVIADISDEPGKEILLGTSLGFFVFDANGQEIVKFRRTYRNITAIAVNNENNFIAFADYYGKIYAINRNGEMLTGFPYNTGEVILSPFILCDLNMDGLLDIITGTAYGSLFVINEKGEVLPSFPITGLNPFYQSPKITDTNNNGDMEIIIMDLKGIVQVFDNKGNIINSYNTNDNQNNTYNEPLIGDIDYDGKEELIIFNRSGCLHILDLETLSREKDIIVNKNDITSTPMLLKDIDNISLIFKDLSGNIIKMEFVKDKLIKNDGSIYYGKTLVNNENTSFLNTAVFSKLKKQPMLSVLEKSYEYVHIKNSIINETLNINYSLKQNGTLKIINKLGQCIYKTTLKHNDKNKQIPLNTLGFSSGEYFAYINYSNNVLKKRFLFIK